MSHTIIVVPCYNEEARLPLNQFRDFIARNPWVQFMMVDDGSCDGTARMLAQLQAEHPQSVRVLSLPHNMGKAEAVRRGFCQALERRPEFIGYWDADLAAPLDALRRFRDTMDRNCQIEAVLGSRIPLLGHAIHRNPLRCLLSRVFAWCASTILGIPIYDTQAGHKLFRVNDRLRYAFATPFRTKWIFDVELLARWISCGQGLSRQQVQGLIYELPLEVWQDVPGSRIRPIDFARAIVDLALVAHYRFGHAASGLIPKRTLHFPWFAVTGRSSSPGEI